METTEREENYYSRTNYRFLWALFAHLPLAFLTAVLNDTSRTFAIFGSLLIIAVPGLLYKIKKDSIQTAIALAVGLVSFSALLIHLSNGMTEMHFHIFSSLGIIIVLAQPVASLAALAVVAVHHVAFYFFIPKSLINYEAGIHILIIHALFAIATGIPSAFIAKKFKSYVVVVNDIVRQTESISENIVRSSKSINETSQVLAESTELESSALEQTTVTVTNLSKLAEENAKKAVKVQIQSESSQVKSEKGQRSIELVYGAVVEIKQTTLDLVNAVEQSNRRLADISEVIKGISKKTLVINDIVFQTKLLSFNASIEAARAGEHGTGFAVVAQEVGNLAMLSGKSAQDIDQMVQGSIKKVDTIVQETKTQIEQLVNHSSIKVDECLRITEECRDILTEVSRETGSTSVFSKEISQSSAEQSVGISEITKATDHIRGSSVRNAKLVVDTSVVSEELSRASDDLSHAIHSLKIAIGQPDKESKAS